MAKIIVVDDQLGIRILLEEVFRSRGYSVLTAGKGEEALEIVDAESPNLMLLDLKLPGMNGLEILHNLRKRGKDIKVIMMTAYGELPDIEEAKELGIVTCLFKPFDIEEALTVVRNVLGKEVIVI